ncbi:MAG: universal stress protein [Alphaproteobacteria bacterium]|nr:universal stress protein [Alphaproteobacteria bacterium]
MKRIFVPLLGELGDRTALDAAGKLLGPSGGHVDARVIRRDPRDVLPIVGEGFGAAMIDEVMSAAEKASKERADKAKQAFDHWVSAAGAQVDAKGETGGLSASFGDLVGPIPGVEVAAERVCDAVMCSRVPKDVSPDRAALMEVAVMEAGRPVIIVPDAEIESIGTKIVVAWNGSAEAARAVSMAMPLLARAERVVVLTVADGDVSSDPEDLAATLRANGIQADAVTAEMDRAGVAATLEVEAGKQHADLILIGAYSHSRVREFVMGGVTDDALTEGSVPMMLAR